MDSGIKLNFFPKNKLEALALLYVQAQNLSEKTPAEVVSLYQAAYAEMKAAYADTR